MMIPTKPKGYDDVSTFEGEPLWCLIGKKWETEKASGADIIKKIWVNPVEFKLMGE